MNEDQIQRWKGEMEKMLREAKAFKDCPSRWRQGYADGIEDALFAFERMVEGKERERKMKKISEENLERRNEKCTQNTKQI